MHQLFFYGTLRDLDVLSVVLGRGLEDITFRAAELEGFACMRVAGHGFPMIAASKGARAPGLLVSGLTGDDVARLSFYEGAYLYELADFDVICDGNPEIAEVFTPVTERWTPDGAWDLEDWRAEDQGVSAEAAREVMQEYGVREAHEVYEYYGSIRAHAQQRLAAAAHSAPSVIRHGFSRDDVKEIEASRPYAKYFSAEDHRVRHRRFDGSLGAPVDRAVWVSGDAVTVLPYDPVNDLVLVIEQFRAGAYVRGDKYPWLLEPVAGRRDAGESYEQTAIRETIEESGIELKSLEKIASYYPSPGAFSEYLVSYVGIADLSNAVSSIHGLDAEQEDIRTIVLSYGELQDALTSGEADTGPLVLSAFWLAANRDRLRAL